MTALVQETLWTVLGGLTVVLAPLSLPLAGWALAEWWKRTAKPPRVLTSRDSYYGSSSSEDDDSDGWSDEEVVHAAQARGHGAGDAAALVAAARAARRDRRRLARENRRAADEAFLFGLAVDAVRHSVVDADSMEAALPGQESDVVRATAPELQRLGVLDRRRQDRESSGDGQGAGAGPDEAGTALLGERRTPRLPPRAEADAGADGGL